MRQYKNPYVEINRKIREEGGEILKHEDHYFYLITMDMNHKSERHLVDSTTPNPFFALHELELRGNLYRMQRLTIWRYIKYVQTTTYPIIEVI